MCPDPAGTKLPITQREKQRLKAKERGEQMNSYEHELAKQRMAGFINDREADRLARELRQSRGSRKGMGIRAVAFVITLFRI